jgi:transcription antitermination protein NusB
MNTNKNSFQYKREGRVIAFQVLFSLDVNQTSLEDLLKFGWLEDEYSKSSLDYAKFLIEGTIKNISEVDNTIKSKLRNWDFDRLSSIDKAILRFSVFSLLNEKDLPEKIIINEAIEIVKQFGTEESYKFINGILDAVKRK